MHRFSDQTESPILGRFSRRALFVGAIASVPAIASAASASSDLPRELPVQRVNRLAVELAEAMDDWMSDISHSDHPQCFVGGACLASLNWPRHLL